jgi:uncharacterized spore protein YtfJ
MIDYLVGGEFMNVTSSKGATPYINTGSPITGMVSFDGSSQTMKVYDGHGWQTIGGGSGTVNLSYDAISILKWAQKKMLEEAERNKLAETNPAIKDLVEQIKQKEEQINMVQTLLNSPGDYKIKNSMVP